MRTELTTKILIKRNPEAVFDYISECENDVYWRRGVISMVQSTKGYTDLTTIQDESISLFGKTFKVKAIITRYVHNSGYAFRVFKGIPGLTGCRKVQSSGDDTIFTYSINVESNIFVALLIQPLKLIFKHRFQNDLKRLKFILEKVPERSEENLYVVSRPLQILHNVIFNLLNGTIFVSDKE